MNRHQRIGQYKTYLQCVSDCRISVFKIISEGDNIKIPPIKMNDVNFK